MYVYEGFDDVYVPGLPGDKSALNRKKMITPVAPGKQEEEEVDYGEEGEEEGSYYSEGSDYYD